MFQGMQPVQRYEMPVIQFSQEEREVWVELGKANEEGLQNLTEKLFQLRESGVAVSSLS